MANLQKTIIDSTLSRVESLRKIGGLTIPQDYSVSNAIQAAGLILAETRDKNGKLVLESCTQSSIANALYKMVIMGLNPLKNQCYFVAYDNVLKCQIGYEGDKMLAKKYAGVKDIFAHTIYEGDIFEYSLDVITGLKKVIKYQPKMENISNDKIKGFFCVIIREDGLHDLNVMTFEEVKRSWLMRKGNGLARSHKEFPSAMGQRTIIRNTCGHYINSSSDAGLMKDIISEVTEEEEEDTTGKVESFPILVQLPEKKVEQKKENSKRPSQVAKEGKPQPKEEEGPNF